MRQLMQRSTSTARQRLQTIAATALTGCLCIALSGLALHVSPARASACAAQNNYTGPVDGEWSVEGNWSNKLPKTGETVCIPEGKGTIAIAAGVKAEVKMLLAQSGVSVTSTASLAISEKFFMEEPAKNEERATRFMDGLTIDTGAVVSTDGAWILMTGPVVLEGEIDNTTGNVNEVVARLESGTLTGDGVLKIPFGNIAGTVEPGGPDAIGALHLDSISGQTAAGTLVLDIASKTSFDEIVMKSNVSWQGTLEVNLIGGYEPPVGTEFLFQTGGGALQFFETITPGFRAEPEPNSLAVVVTPKPPSVVTGAATEVQPTTAVLNGTVNPNNLSVNACEFEYGTTTAYGGKAGCGGIAAHSNTPVSVSGIATGLTPGTTYHYRIFAKNEIGSNHGEDHTFTTAPASKEVEKEAEKTGGSTETKTGGGSGSGGASTSGSGGSGTNAGGASSSASSSSASSATASAVASEKAIEKVLLGCSTRPLVLNDVVQQGNKVLLIGAAARAQAGKQVKIVFGSSDKVVATATVDPSGEFSTTAPLPPAKIRGGNGARYMAELGSLRSLDLKLTRRLALEPPSVAAGKVTLRGQVVPPLAKPVATVTVSQQVDCGKTTVVARARPSANGDFKVTLPAPAGAQGARYRLTSSVAQSRGSRHSFATYSLPLPAVLK
ncbi:MAG TPA: fibronectin type III domain-containing protein [Solirubrobacteraceae bacterium]|jgi:hypothetical protein